MGYENATANEAYEFFKNMREIIRTGGMNGQRYNAISQRITAISNELKKNGPNEDLVHVKMMGMSLIQRQKVM